MNITEWLLIGTNLIISIPTLTYGLSNIIANRKYPYKKYSAIEKIQYEKIHELEVLIFQYQNPMYDKYHDKVINIIKIIKSYYDLKITDNAEVVFKINVGLENINVLLHRVYNSDKNIHLVKKSSRETVDVELLEIYQKIINTISEDIEKRKNMVEEKENILLTVNNRVLDNVNTIENDLNYSSDVFKNLQKYDNSFARVQQDFNSPEHSQHASNSSQNLSVLAHNELYIDGLISSLSGKENALESDIKRI